MTRLFSTFQFSLPLLHWLAGLATAQSTRFIFAFGDSLTDHGFNEQSTQPNIFDPFGNPGEQSSFSRTDDYGPNWLERIVYNINGTLSPAHVVAWDFARYGATADNLALSLNNMIPDFAAQVGYFNSEVGPSDSSGVAWTADNSLVTVWFGTNDVHADINGDVDRGNYDQVMDVYYNNLEKMYTAGVRRFLLLTVGPINRTPRWLNPPDSERVRSHVSTYNSLLTGSRLSTFQSAHPDASVSLLNSQDVWNPILDNPTAYGAPNSYCSNKDGTSCLFWDKIHPAMAIHNATAYTASEKMVGLGFFQAGEVQSGSNTGSDTGGSGSSTSSSSGSGSSSGSSSTTSAAPSQTTPTSTSAIVLVTTAVLTATSAMFAGTPSSTTPAGGIEGSGEGSSAGSASAPSAAAPTSGTSDGPAARFRNGLLQVAAPLGALALLAR